MQGEKLKNLDSGRDKSDTQVVLKMKWQADQKDWTEVDHTEIVHDNLDPKYEHHFDVVYNFGQKVLLRFDCNDVDADGKTQHIGSCEIGLAEVV